jgi:hypothetical protein
MPGAMDQSYEFQFLSRDDIVLFQALLPAMVGPGLTRVTVARVWSSWENASTQSVDAFLERWRTSGVGLFNNGYIALTKVSNVAFYGHEDHWHLSGYPGPPTWAVDALPQFKDNA